MCSEPVIISIYSMYILVVCKAQQQVYQFEVWEDNLDDGIGIIITAWTWAL